MALAVLDGFVSRPYSPPATSTWPLPSRVALLPMRQSKLARQRFSPPVAADQVPVAGLYSSALVGEVLPPRTSTSPSGRTALSSWNRAVFMLPVTVQVP